MPLTLVLLLIVAVCLLFVMVDASVNLHEWLLRIHIGQWQDRDVWQQAVERKAKEWLIHAPTVRQTAQNRLVLWDIIRGKYRNSTIQTWQDAGLILGLGKQAAVEYSKTHKGVLEKKKIMPEDLLLAYALKQNGSLNPHIEEHILSCFLNVKEQGTIYYRPWVKDIRFVDTLGMVLPFLHACGWDDLAKRQMDEYDKALLNGVFPAHAYNVETELPMGVFDWGRGIGWYILALIETADMEGQNERIMKLAKALLPHQKGDGGFGCFVFNPQSRMESSATVLIGLLFLCAYEQTKDATFLDAARQTEKALMKATRRNGAVDYCQGDTYGIGYYSQIFSVMPFVQGLALRLSKEIDTFDGDEQA